MNAIQEERNKLDISAMEAEIKGLRATLNEIINNCYFAFTIAPPVTGTPWDTDLKALHRIDDLARAALLSRPTPGEAGLREACIDLGKVLAGRIFDTDDPILTVIERIRAALAQPAAPQGERSCESECGLRMRWPICHNHGCPNLKPRQPDSKEGQG